MTYFYASITPRGFRPTNQIKDLFFPPSRMAKLMDLTEYPNPTDKCRLKMRVMSW